MAALIGQLIGPVTGLLDKFIEDKDQKAALAHEIATMSERHAQEALKGQLDINKVEAAHKSLFVAGWRPFIGWICGVALAYNFVVRDLIIWLTPTFETPPALQMDHLMTVLLGMLGLGGLRTYEKIKDKVK